MKLLSKLFVALAMVTMLSGTVLAADKSAKQLRSEAAVMYEKADQLVVEALKQEQNPAVKSRGYGSHSCVMDCIGTSTYKRGGLFACRRACGSY